MVDFDLIEIDFNIDLQRMSLIKIVLLMDSWLLDASAYSRGNLKLKFNFENIFLDDLKWCPIVL